MRLIALFLSLLSILASSLSTCVARLLLLLLVHSVYRFFSFALHYLMSFPSVFSSQRRIYRLDFDPVHGGLLRADRARALRSLPE